MTTVCDDYFFGSISPPPLVKLDTATPTSTPLISLETRRIVGMSAEDYFGTDGYESNSSLKPALRSLAHYVHNKENPMEDKPHFHLGSAIHAALLEPKRFKADYVVSKVFDCRTKVGKEAKAEFIKNHLGKIIITDADLEAITGIAENVSYHDDAMRLLKDGTNEVSYFWQNPETGIWMRARTDSESKFATLDIKSTEDASQKGFLKACMKYSYDMQAFIYTEARSQVTGEDKRFAFLAVEKKAPYTVGLYMASNEMLASGAVQYREALKRIQQYRANPNARFGYQPEGRIEELEWPTYAYFR